MKIHRSDFLRDIPGFQDKSIIHTQYHSLSSETNRPLIILDDDPTGIQTIHGMDLYTAWDPSVMEEIFTGNKKAFIQTNTRAYSESKVKKLITELMDNLLVTARRHDKDFDLVSRGDSTLRGHYPLETDLIREKTERDGKSKLKGEILIPFFREGGRFTVNDIHWVLDGDYFIPAAETEFAGDPDFGYLNSDLCRYIEEKTRGKYLSQDVISIPISMIRQQDIQGIKNLLVSGSGYRRIIVNTMDYKDLEVFMLALMPLLSQGVKFLYRTAASFVKTFTFNPDRAMLSAEEIGGKRISGEKILLVAGSYTGKTSRQLNHLLDNMLVTPVEASVPSLLAGKEKRDAEINRVSERCSTLLAQNKNPALFTSRTLITGKDHLETGTLISESLVRIVEQIRERPELIITKGGITSSVIISDALNIRKARVMGQILPGVPAIKAGNDSKWPANPCVIFPGNVGMDDSITRIYKLLRP